MKKNSSYLRNTTILTESPSFLPPSYISARQGKIIDRSSKPGMRNNHSSTGILFSAPIKVPPLGEEEICRRDEVKSGFVTRHLKYKDLDLALGGSFRFGTIRGCRPADAILIGRFSDIDEGYHRQVLRSPDGNYNVSINGGGLSNVRVEGHQNPVVVEYDVNEYCSCSSF